jgi:tRNA dimethylallyltransferase
MGEGQGEAGPPLLVVVGPTAVGKTGIAVRLAEALDGRIISADSRQVYVGMDIGTAKPSAAEQARALHALVDILQPDERLTLAGYQDRAYEAIEAAHAAGRLPTLVGGTGQYVRAVVEGWGIPRVPPQPALRADLTGMAYVYGATALHAWLAEVDPAAAEAIDYRNVRRVVRALEVYLIAGQPISVLQERTPPPYRIMQIGLTRPRESLYRRIDERVDRMMAEGLVDEVRALLEAGYGWDLSSMSSLGYRQFAPYFEGEASLEEAAQAIKRETRRFVRQQATWFRPDDPAITWFDLDKVGFERILNVVREWLDG